MYSILGYFFWVSFFDGINGIFGIEIKNKEKRKANTLDRITGFAG